MELKQFIISSIVFLGVCYLFLFSGFGIGKLFFEGVEKCWLSMTLIWGACFVIGLGASIK